LKRLDQQAFWRLIGSELPQVHLPDEGRKLFLFAEEVARWSGRVHLVGKKNIADTIGTLVLDSLHLIRFAEEAGALREATCGRKAAVADIGSGAGFPGMVWKIARPDLDVSLFERRRKPSAFLERTIAALGLEGVCVIEADAGRDGGGRSFDIVVSKAAGRLDVTVPIVEGMLRLEGAYLTIKGPGWQQEAAAVGSGALRLDSSEPLPDGRGAMLLLRRRAQRPGCFT
jgi:16S rRNA (guanine(527)-N(7))-methyltransferase RsmG